MKRFIARISSAIGSTSSHASPSESPARVKYGCEGKGDLLGQLAYMVGYAPNFPTEDEMTLELAFATLEYGLRQLELKDGSSDVLDAVDRMRDAFSKAKTFYDDGQRLAAQRLLVSAENILKPVKVKSIVR